MLKKRHFDLLQVNNAIYINYENRIIIYLHVNNFLLIKENEDAVKDLTRDIRLKMGIENLGEID